MYSYEIKVLTEKTARTMKKKHENRPSSARKPHDALGEIFVGFQWGEHYEGEQSFRLERSGNRLEISAAMPFYRSENRPSDLIRQYELARAAHKGTKGTSKYAPNIRFANADSEEEQIEFVRQFGPVAASASTNRLPDRHVETPDSGESKYLEVPMCAVQDLVELKDEQRIYKAAISLVLELRRPEKEYDAEIAAGHIIEIARLVRNWPLQWRRERKARGEAPLWKVRPGTIERIAAMGQRNPFEILPPQVDARIVLCQLLNVFPSLVFPNPLEMHSYLHFGIRPLLYSLLRREFLNTFDAAVCTNPSCRNYFEVERAGQQYCSPECSRQHRQRAYWEARGKNLRVERKRESTNRQSM